MCNSESTAGRQPCAGAYGVTDNLSLLRHRSVCVGKRRSGKGRKGLFFHTTHYVVPGGPVGEY